MRKFASHHLSLAVAVAAAMSGSAAADTFTVNSTLDAVDDSIGDGICATITGTCTLRAAVQEANAQVGADTIILPAGNYMRTIPGDIEDASATGDLDVLPDGLSILGAGATTTIIDANSLGRVIHVLAGAELTLRDLTLEDGDAPITGGAGIFMAGGTEVTLERVIVQGNAAGPAGGGGLLHGGDTLTIDESTFRFNTAVDEGGAMVINSGTAEITNSTFNDNTATNGDGGAIDNDGLLMVTNSTFSDNSAGDDGGAIFATNVTDLTHVTIAANTAADDGGGIFNSGSTVNLLNSILDDNGPENCDGSGIASGGGNVSSDSSCGLSEPSDQEDADPRLGPLQNNGGSTETHALLDGSDALDAALNAGCTPADQRGEPRPLDGDGDGITRCDAGAVEGPGMAPVPALPLVGLGALGVLLGAGGFRRLRRRP